MLHQQTNLWNFLPAKTIQSCRGNLSHIQVLLSVFFVEQNYFHDNNMHRVPNRWVFVQWRHHIHYRQQICLNITAIVKLHHRRISNDKRFNVSWCYHRSCHTFLVVPLSLSFALLILFLFLPMIPYFAATLNDNL